MPDSVKELIISLRNYLQDTCEPPVYVSDRRLLKAVAMLKVSNTFKALFEKGKEKECPFPPRLEREYFSKKMVA